MHPVHRAQFTPVPGSRNIGPEPYVILTDDGGFRR